jgi:hypothetical protein
MSDKKPIMYQVPVSTVPTKVFSSDDISAEELCLFIVQPRRVAKCIQKGTRLCEGDKLSDTPEKIV